MPFSRRFKWRMLLATAIFTLSVGVTLVVLREPMSTMTRTNLDHARNQWHQTGMVDYDVRYLMNGSAYSIEVRSGIVKDALVDGQQPLSSDWRSYAMDGLFEILSLELDNQEEGIGSFAGGGQVPMRVRFNHELGYIERYIRGGLGRAAVIEAVELKTIDIHNLNKDNDNGSK